MFANFLILKLLRLMLNLMLFATYFELISELVSVCDIVAGEKFPSGAMFDPELSVSLDWLTHKCGSWTIWGLNLPNAIIVWLGSEAHLCVTRETSEYLWGELAGVQIQWFVENVRIRDETNLVTIANLIFRIWIVNTLDKKNGSATRSDIIGCGCASICFIN